MTLGRRALLLIFPVILASFCVAAVTVYFVERSALLRLEKTRLDQYLAQLGILYENDETIARGLLASLTGTSQFQRFFREKDDALRTQALTARLERTLRSLTRDRMDFVSLAVISAGLDVVYYGENSDDPFAEIAQEQKDLAANILQGRAWPQETHHLSLASGPLIVVSDLLDPQTMKAPIGLRIRDAVLVQIAVRPMRFLDAVRRVEATYGTPIEIVREPIDPEGELSVVSVVGQDMRLRMTPSQAYFEDRTRSLRLLLGGGAVGMSLLVITLLMGLVRRFITKPVSELERQVNEIVSGDRESIGLRSATGEVGRLALNVKRLHETVADSLKRISQASNTDTLTGISNRAHFGLLAAQTLTAAQRTGGARTLLFIDIDNFKFVNDRYGHEAGDDLLREIARRIEAELREDAPGTGTIFARLSGDEFAVLLPLEADEAGAVASAIVALFQNGFIVEGERYPVSASIGLSSYPDHASNLDELVASADAAMYRAKQAGRNRCVRYTAEIRAERQRERMIQEELRRLAPDEEFALVYMPITDRAGRVVSCEALLRWTSPSLGIVRPDEFVPIAEHNGLFVKIDRWVIDRALSDYSTLRGWFGPDFVLSINVSCAEFHTATLLPYLLDRCRAWEVPTDRVELELTETFALQDGATAGADIAAMRASGFRIAIDDYGAGFTCIRQVIEYQADTIKLDRFFLERLTTASFQTTLRAMIALCHAQGMRVVAEGVDSDGKLEALARAGCDYLQGFGISPPRPLPELGVWALRRTLGSEDGGPHPRRALSAD